MTLPPSPEAQIDVQAACAKVPAAVQDFRIGYGSICRCEQDRAEGRLHAHGRCLVCLFRIVLDAYEAKVRENAELRATIAAFEDGSERLSLKGIEMRTEIDALTAALAEARNLPACDRCQAVNVTRADLCKECYAHWL
jgi:ribosomal protein L40E